MAFLHDTKLIFFRNLQKTLRNPIWVAFGLFQPLCFFLLFTPLLTKLVNVPGFGFGNTLNVFTPGLLIMMAMFSAWTGMAFIDDIRSGVIERLMVTPISRAAILVGRSLRDTLILLIQSFFIIILAWLFGMSAPILGILFSLIIALILGFTFAVLSHGAALILQNEDSLAPALNFFLLPMQLLAGIMLPITMAPSWLQKLALLNPLSYAVAASRELFNGSYANTIVLQGFGVTLLVACLALYWTSRLFNRF